MSSTRQNISRIASAMVVSGLVLAGQASAQVPQDNTFVKKHPYFTTIDKGDLSNGARDQVAQDLKTKKDWRQEQLDQIYAQLTSGPMPAGFHNGNIIFAVDSGVKMFEKMGMPVDEKQITALGEMLWKGKYFDPKMGYLKNRIDCSKFSNWLGQLGVPTNSVYCSNSGEGIRKKNLKFPAKLFCGQSLLDGRRESIIIDYSYGNDVITDVSSSLWDPKIDWLATKKALKIRDEIRMVRPGLYLGRAYIHGAFALWFTLEYDEGQTVASDVPSGYPGTKDLCWIGNQRQRQRGWGYSSYVNNGDLK